MDMGTEIALIEALNHIVITLAEIAKALEDLCYNLDASIRKIS